MPQIVEQKVDIGHDSYGRPVTMTRYKSYDGRILWRIVTTPIEQRDDEQKIDGLTDSNIREMVAALGVISKFG